MRVIRFFPLAAAAVFLAMMDARAQEAADPGQAGLQTLLDDLVGGKSSAGGATAQREKFFSSVQRALQAGDWEMLSRLGAEAPPAIPAPLRDLLHGYAEMRSGRGGPGETSLRKGLAAAAANGRLAALTAFADRIGAKRETDAALLALCRQPDEAGPAFAAVRLRVTDPAKVAAAYDAAHRAAPDAPPVRDYERYLALLDGRAVDMAEVEAAVAAAPKHPLPRLTLLLARLRSDQPATALGALDDVMLVFNAMPPGSQALISAAYAAAGQNERALQMASSVNTSLLMPGEYAMIVPLRAERAAADFSTAGSWRTLSGKEPRTPEP